MWGVHCVTRARLVSASGTHVCYWQIDCNYAVNRARCEEKRAVLVLAHGICIYLVIINSNIQPKTERKLSFKPFPKTLSRVRTHTTPKPPSQRTRNRLKAYMREAYGRALLLLRPSPKTVEWKFSTEVTFGKHTLRMCRAACYTHNLPSGACGCDNILVWS